VSELLFEFPKRVGSPQSWGLNLTLQTRACSNSKSSPQTAETLYIPQVRRMRGIR
jgi:hypothetical protein